MIRRINPYVNQAIIEQDPLASYIDFPLDENHILFAMDYEDYCSLLENLLAERKQVCETLTLTRGNEALPGFLAYLKTAASLPFNEIALNLTESPDHDYLEALKETLILLSKKGLATLKLVNKSNINIDPSIWATLIPFITTNHIATEIDFPAGNEKTQQEVDELISIYQRERRIALFEKEHALELKPQDKIHTPRRTRKEKSQNQGIDIDVDSEIQVDAAVEIAVANTVTKQFEVKAPEQKWINREEFIRLVREKKFEISEADYTHLQDHTKNTWDIWLGNISHLKVKSKGTRHQHQYTDVTQLAFYTSIYPPTATNDILQYDENIRLRSASGYYDCAFVLVLPTQGPRTLYFVQKNLRPPATVTLVSLNAQQLNTFINEHMTLFDAGKIIDPDSMGGDFRKINLQTGISIPGRHTTRVTHRIDDPEESKGHVIYDATTVHEDEKSIEQLKQACPIKFKKSEVVEELYENPKLHILSKTACEILLKHQAQFQYGIDFEHLPAGLELLEETSPAPSGRERNILVLDYKARKARVLKKDPLAIQWYLPPEPQPLSHDLFTLWMNDTVESTVDNNLKEFYRALLKRGSQRKQVRAFKQYLPMMLGLPATALQQAAQSGLDELIKAAKQEQRTLAKTEAVLEKHLIYRLAHTNAALIKLLQEWNKELKFSIGDLNGLLAVYNAFGENGIFALLASWKKENLDPKTLKYMHQHYFPHLKTYLPLLEPRYQEAVNIIQHFNAEERNWWETLFSKHCAAVGADNVYALVKAFQEFLIKKPKNLTLHSPCYFEGVKSLPVTLSRLLSLINNTRPEDLNEVWKDITKLNFQSNAGIRLITDNENKPRKGQLLLPIMQLQPEFYLSAENCHFTRSDESDHGYHRRQVRQTQSSSIRYHVNNFIYGYNYHSNIIARSTDQKELERNYYRFIASQENRLSLKFYQEAAKIIEGMLYTFSPLEDYFKLRTCLYTVVAESTSGFQRGLYLHDEATSLAEVRAICQSINDTSLPWIALTLPLIINRDFRANLLYTCAQCAPTPPLPYFKEIIAVAQKAYTHNILSLTSPSAIKEHLNTFEHLNRGISRLYHKYGYAFYEGVQFSKSNELCKFIDVANEINEGFIDLLAYDADDEKQMDTLKVSFISLMSTFQFSQENISKILTFSSHPSRAEKRLLAISSHAFAILSKMQKHLLPQIVGENPFNEAGFNKFYTDLKSKVDTSLSHDGFDAEQIAAVMVKETFAAYFTPGCFDSLQSLALSPEVEGSICKNFPLMEEEKLVNTILLSFKEMADQHHRITAVKSLKGVCNKLSETDRIPFLTKLSSLNKKNDNRLEDLNNLLVAIGEKGHANDFDFIVSCADARETPQLIPKIIAFYNKSLPLMRQDTKPKELSRLAFQPLMGRLVLNSNVNDAKNDNFIISVTNTIFQLVGTYPSEKTGILSFFDQLITAIKQHHPADRFNQLITDFSLQLQELIKFKDANLIHSLFEHYHKNPQGLENILICANTLQKTPDQYQLLKIIAALLNNGRDCTPTVLKKFLDLHSKDKNNDLLSLAGIFFQCPPYPTFEQIIDWHKKTQGKIKEMHQFYQAYNLKPCERELDNGFKLGEAHHFIPLFKGIKFKQPELETLANEAKAFTEISTADLRAELNKFMQLPLTERSKAHPRLLALLAELLYRSKGAPGEPGSSYEINTVQYLAILAFLKTGKGHINSEIATGEGKSRIMMLAVACQYALGKTVDFVTSDLQLASRDYLDFDAFFKIIGAETRLITATSDTSLYKFKGIHFSDAANLNLFRNTARSNGEGGKVTDPDAGARALLLDEADKTFFDISETRFNYSQEANDDIKNMEWIYPLLIRFFNQEDEKRNKENRTLFQTDIDGCRQAFIKFLQAQSDYVDEWLSRIHALTFEQVEAWQEAAITALDLKWGVDYMIESPALISTPQGPKIASEARLIYGHRLSKNSKFSFGVHQCLHAYLNQQLANPNSAIAIRCRELNKKTNSSTNTPPFILHAEKQIVYSSTSKSFVDEYKKGDVWAVTGRAGAICEQEEGAGLYGREEEKEENRMRFIQVPRKNPLKRIDRLFHLTGNFKQQVEVTLEYILEAKTAGRPVLVICENDQEAELLRDALAAAFKKRLNVDHIPSDKWQFVDSTTSAEEEKGVIRNAGETGCITIATSRLGRGTDIKLTEAAKTAGGLRVIGTYLPRDRDQGQMFGRSGRYGDEGDTRLVVNRKQLCRILGKKKLDTQFFLANEFYLKDQQARIDREKQVERLIRNALSDFRIKITDAFFKYFDALDKDDRKNKLILWSNFTKQIDQLWNQSWPDLMHFLSKPKIDMHAVKNRLAKFKADAQAKWQHLHAKLKADPNLLPKQLDKLVLDHRTEYLIRLLTPKRRYTVKDKTMVYKAYEKSLDGRAAVYSELFADWKAVWQGKRLIFANTRAWWNGHGILFADTRAWWAGNRVIFATLRVWWNGGEVTLHAKKEPLKHKSILRALKQYDQENLSQIIQGMDSNKFLKPRKGDYLISFKLELVETVLDFAHRRIEKGYTLSNKEMDEMRSLLQIVRGHTDEQTTNLISKVNSQLLSYKTRFFGESLKGRVSQVIAERTQEHQKDQNAIDNNDPGWGNAAAAA